MRALLALPRDMLAMPRVWLGWMALLIALNAVAPLFLIATWEGRAVFAAFLISAMLMMAIHRVKGFVRLLGVAHFVWFPLLIWLATRLEAMSGPMRIWVITLFVVNGVSLAIDVFDLVRYARGSRDIATV